MVISLLAVKITNAVVAQSSGSEACIAVRSSEMADSNKIQILPHAEELTSLTGNERKFYNHYVQVVSPSLDYGFEQVGTHVLNAVGEFALNLGPKHFSHPVFRGYGVHRLIDSLAGPGALVGDILAGEHRDTSPTALVARRMKPGQVGELEAQLPNGTFAAIDLSDGSFSWNFGWVLYLYALYKNDIPLDLSVALEDQLPENTVGIPQPTIHRVLRREHEGVTLPVNHTLTDNLSSAYFSGADDRLLVAPGITYAQARKLEFAKFLQT